MRPYISNKETQKMINLLTERYGFESDYKVIDEAVKLLWKTERDKALLALAVQQKKFYEENPEESKFLAKITGFEQND